MQRRTRHDVGCAPTLDTECESVVQRTVWDGDQVLQERRAAGSDSTPVAAMDDDQTVVTYTHLAGIDAPVAILKGSTLVVPHANWRAVFDSGHVVGGGPLPPIRWPGRTETLDQAPNTHPHQY